VKSKRNWIRFSTIIALASAFFLFLSGVLAQSTPTGPNTLTVVNSTRYPQSNQSSYAVQAQAGNVTELIISQRRSTEAWQGYYGNITGTITLDDANNQTLFDWSLPNPTGEIYAANDSTVDWTKVFCYNLSQNSSEGPACNPSGCGSTNTSAMELKFGINLSDHDGINETFNSTYTDATGFFVGSVNFNAADGCSMANPFTDENSAAGWQEVMLSDNKSIIFTSLVRDSQNAYRGGGADDKYDFQLLVLENGHVGSELTTSTYYFFVELT